MNASRPRPRTTSAGRIASHGGRKQYVQEIDRIRDLTQKHEGCQAQQRAMIVRDRDDKNANDVNPNSSAISGVHGSIRKKGTSPTSAGSIQELWPFTSLTQRDPSTSG